MHALKFRRRAYGSVGTNTTPNTASDRHDTQMAAVQILTVGILSGLCCFTGSLLILQVL
ncbi:MAG: hypothetical protein AAF268_02710 [Cyanobacteria bacterium P01_A01_bin.3]